MKTALLAALLLVTSACADRPHPLAAHRTPEPFSFDGTVTERLAAGPYTYLFVGGRWVATLTATCPTASTVAVTGFGHAPHFHSARLDRDFSPLVFGAVRAVSPQSFERKP